jgi:hypothetical protein
MPASCAKALPAHIRSMTKNIICGTQRFINSFRGEIPVYNSFNAENYKIKMESPDKILSCNRFFRVSF